MMSVVTRSAALRARIARLPARAVRRVPERWVGSLVKVRLRRALSDPHELEVARDQMTFLLEHGDPSADIEAAAPRYVERMTWRAELRYHPELITHQPVTGIEHVLATSGPTGGLIINFMHHGQFDGAFGSLSAPGFRR